MKKKYKNLKSGIARLRFFSQKMPYFLAGTLGNLKKVLWGLPKVLEKISFLKGKKITNKIFVRKIRPLMAKRKIFLSLYIYMYIYTYIHIYICIYIYRERERNMCIYCM